MNKPITLLLYILEGVVDPPYWYPVEVQNCTYADVMNYAFHSNFSSCNSEDEVIFKCAVKYITDYITGWEDHYESYYYFYHGNSSDVCSSSMYSIDC